MITVLHAQGFTDKRGPREIHVSSQEAETVHEVARKTLDAAVSDSTRIKSFRCLWPISHYGIDAAVVEVNAVTETTLDGEKWIPMWHWFGTASSPWPLAAKAVQP